MTPDQITILIIDVFSIAFFCFGLRLHRNLSIDRHAFLSVLHGEEHLQKPRLMSALPWVYVFVTCLVILLSIVPLFRQLSFS